MNALAIGGAGFAGRAPVETLLKREYAGSTVARSVHDDPFVGPGAEETLIEQLAP